MKREELPNETPREDLMREALKHYEELATKACWHRSDIPDAIRAYYTPLPPAEDEFVSGQMSQMLGDIIKSRPAEGAETCWNCGIDLRNAPDGVTKHHCICGAINPGERQPQPTAEGANCFYYDKPGKEKITTELQPTAEGAVRHLTDDEIEKHGMEGGLRDGELQMYWEGATWYRSYAQKIADKMVEERLREELIGYDNWMCRQKWGMGEIWSPAKTADKYLKSRDSHE